MGNIIDSLIDRTADWLRYAEAKNAALVAYAGVLIGLFGDNDSKCKLWVFLGILLTSIGLGIALISFLPKTNSHFKSQSDLENLNEETFNLFAWPDLAKATPSFVLDYVKKNINSSVYQGGLTKEALLTQIDQLIILAQITETKNSKFICALVFCMLGTLAFLINIAVTLFS